MKHAGEGAFEPCAQFFEKGLSADMPKLPAAAKKNDTKLSSVATSFVPAANKNDAKLSLTAESFVPAAKKSDTSTNDGKEASKKDDFSMFLASSESKASTKSDAKASAPAKKSDTSKDDGKEASKKVDTKSSTLTKPEASKNDGKKASTKKRTKASAPLKPETLKASKKKDTNASAPTKLETSVTTVTIFDATDKLKPPFLESEQSLKRRLVDPSFANGSIDLCISDPELVVFEQGGE